MYIDTHTHALIYKLSDSISYIHVCSIFHYNTIRFQDSKIFLMVENFIIVYQFYQNVQLNSDSILIYDTA